MIGVFTRRGCEMVHVVPVIVKDTREPDVFIIRCDDVVTVRRRDISDVALHFRIIGRSGSTAFKLERRQTLPLAEHIADETAAASTADKGFSANGEGRNVWS